MAAAGVHHRRDGGLGQTLVVGDDDWGIAPAEVVEYDEDSGALVLWVLAELQAEASTSLSGSA